MNQELSLYKIWKKMIKKTNKNEDELLNEICNEDKNIINILKSFSMKINIRKTAKYDRRNL